MKTLKFVLVLAVLLAVSAEEAFAWDGRRSGGRRVIVIERSRQNGNPLKDLLVFGGGVGTGILLDRTVLRPDPYYGRGYPQPVYGPSYGLPSCADLPTSIEQDRCEKAEQRAAEREREREVRERLRNAERLGEALGRSRY